MRDQETTFRVSSKAAENKRIGEAVDGYDLATVTSDDEADLKQLLSDIEKQLESANLTEAEASELKNGKAVVEDLLERIESTSELFDEVTEGLARYEEDTVKSNDKGDIKQAVEDIDGLLGTDNLTEDEEKALETNGGNYTNEERRAVEDNLKLIDEALKVIERAESIEGLINALPDSIDEDDEEASRKPRTPMTPYLTTRNPL